MSGQCRGLGYCPYERGARDGGLVNATAVNNSPYEAQYKDIRGGRLSFNNNVEGRTHGSARGHATTHVGDRMVRKSK